MNKSNPGFVSSALALSLATVVLLAGCGSNGSDSNGEQVGPTESETSGDTAGPETTGDSAGSETAGDSTGTGATDGSGEVVTTEFDGTWRSDCSKFGVVGVPEEDQPDEYAASTLTIDSSTKSYSRAVLLFTDPECTKENPDDPTGPRSSGEFVFDGTVTTNSGLEATVVRYFSSGTSPDLVGLLYRDGDLLYRELRQSTLIEDIAPTELALSSPLRLVD